MNKAFYIIGIVFAIIFFFVCGFYIADVNSARSLEILSSYSSYDSYSSYSYGSGIAESLTEEAGMISIFFFLSFMVIDLLGLMKVKTKTTKVMAIIGLAISALFLLWDFAMISSPGSMSFDEVGMGFLLYCFIMLAFCIVGLVQSVQSAKMLKTGGTAGHSESHILDP